MTGGEDISEKQVRKWTKVKATIQELLDQMYP